MPPTSEQHRQTQLSDAFAFLQQLHTSEYAKPDALRCTDRIVSLLGETNKDMFQEIKDAQIENDVPVDEIYAKIRRRTFRLLYHHTGYSGPDNPIKSLQFRDLMMEMFLEECVRDGNDPNALRRMGMVLTDVDGLSAVKECIGHDGTNQFLIELTKVFTDPKTPTNVRLEQDGITPTPIVAGGDELLVVLIGKAMMTRKRIGETVEGYETDTTARPELRAMIDFKNPTVLRQYAKKNGLLDGKSETDHQAIFDQISAALRNFVPSITGGGVTLMEGIIVADHGIAEIPPLRSATSFREASSTLSRTMFMVGEERVHDRKIEYKRSVNPAIAAFIDRNVRIGDVLQIGENGDQ